MRKFKVLIYRQGGWFRRWLESWTIKADDFYTHEDEVSFWSYNGDPTGCSGHTVLAQFKADKYSIIEIKE